MIEQITKAILHSQNDPAQLARITALCQSIPGMAGAEVDELLDRILDFGEELESASASVTRGSTDVSISIDQLIQPVIDQLVRRESKLGVDREDERCWSSIRFQNVQSLYRKTPPQSDLRNHLLRWLATSGSDEAIQIWLDLMCDDPPEHRLGIVLAFAPVMQPGFQPPDGMLSQLINHGTSHSQVAPAVFDLLNYYFRQGMVEVHPAAERVNELTDLLGQLIRQLGKIEEGDFPDGFDVGQINQLVSDSVSLIVALCDTFALLEHQPAIAKLHQALELRHRRVQTEAAASLARLGDPAGKQALIALAEEPVARFRVLAYAEELGFLDEISLELRGEIALAESRLAIWLAEPEQMGLAPSRIEFLESRELVWPSFDHPVQCFLFRYSFGSGAQVHSNIGICGPMIHAFAADLQHLSHDDIYAMFAGWQTIHDEIFQISVNRAEATFPNEWRRLVGDLNAEAFDETEWIMAGSFFGELVLIADATRDSQSGTAIVDSQKTIWIAKGNPSACVDWQLAYSIWRGHQLLNTFNESESA